jgi:serine phosphatase RsbU (regulator of sigma subunit)
MRSAAFPPATVGFGSGDLAVLYTDGIVEALSRTAEQFGYERLRQCVEDNRGASSAQITAAIASAVERWTGGAAQDDLTLVVVRNRTV